MHVFSTARISRAAVAGAVTTLAAVAALTGCSSSPHTAADAASTKKAEIATTKPATTTPTQTATTTPVTTSPAPSTPATSPPPNAVPTLGRSAGLFAHGRGFGQVKPLIVDNGGDPTGLVSGITWHSWGGASAAGTGTSDYVSGSQTVAEGTEEPVTIVAFDLGSCGGRLMYRAVEWYFPQHGGTFNTHQYEDVCTGSYVGTP